MAAIFYAYSNRSLFKNSVGHSASPVLTDLFDGLVGATNLCIITQFTVSTSDTIQFFMSFDDFIHHYYFGKALGQISISGMLFSDCLYNKFPGIKKLYTNIGNKRGQIVKFSMDSIYFEGVMTDCTLSMNSEPETTISFTANFGMVNHNMPPPPASAFPKPC